MRLSYSKASTMGSCGRMFYYKYILKLEPDATPLAFPFGHSVDVPATEYIKAHALNQSFDIMSCFEKEWDLRMSGQTVRYPTTWDPDNAYQSAKRLVETFPEQWDNAQLKAVLDEKGEPIVERFLTVPGPPGVELLVRIDCVAMDLRSGATGPLDLKTAASEHTQAFGLNALQLTTYQYACDHTWGEHIGPTQNVGYFEAIKRKVPATARGQGPTWEPPAWYPRRSDAAIHSMLSAYQAIARDIAEKRFHRPFALAFNSPCNLCDYQNLCVTGSKDGLSKRTYKP